MQLGQIERENIDNDLWALHPVHQIALPYQDERIGFSLQDDALLVSPSVNCCADGGKAIALLAYVIQGFFVKQICKAKEY